MKVYVSGKWVDEAEASISVFDHGLLYGDGVFEGIRIYNKRIFLLEEHIDRLFDSAQAIALEIPLSREELIDAVVKSCEINKLSRWLHTLGDHTWKRNTWFKSVSL